MENKPEKATSLPDLLIGRNIKVSLFLISLSILLIVFKYREIPPQVPLFYNLPWGEQQLANKFFLFLLPFFSLLFLSLNTLLARKNQEDFFISKLLVTGALLFTILSMIALAKIIFLVI